MAGSVRHRKRSPGSAANGKFQGTRANVRYLTEHWLEHLERLGRSPRHSRATGA